MVRSEFPSLRSAAFRMISSLHESENGELLEKAASREPLYLSLAAIDHAESLTAAGKMNILYRGIKNPRVEAALKALAIIDVKGEKPVLPLLVEAFNSEYGKVRGEAYRRIKELSFAAKQHIEPLAAVSAVIHEDKDFLGGLTLEVLYELLKKYDSNFFLSGLPVIYSIKAFSPAMLCKYLLHAAVDIKIVF